MHPSICKKKIRRHGEMQTHSSDKCTLRKFDVEILMWEHPILYPSAVSAYL